MCVVRRFRFGHEGGRERGGVGADARHDPTCAHPWPVTQGRETHARATSTKPRAHGATEYTHASHELTPHHTTTVARGRVREENGRGQKQIHERGGRATIGTLSLIVTVQGKARQARRTEVPCHSTATWSSCAPSRRLRVIFGVVVPLVIRTTKPRCRECLFPCFLTVTDV
ncbi:hypothetical protein BJV74DRAFT_111493 [Russula compacta]|nr:hypothetical protein BJV74DRAFT_111493 [Russula compacta]